MKEFEADLIDLLCSIESPAEMKKFLKELLTFSEYAALQKRWAILRLLSARVTQRDVARRIDGSLCNVTRGARILRNPNSVAKQLLKQLENNNDYASRPKRDAGVKNDEK